MAEYWPSVLSCNNTPNGKGNEQHKFPAINSLPSTSPFIAGDAPYFSRAKRAPCECSDSTPSWSTFEQGPVANRATFSIFFVSKPLEIAFKLSQQIEIPISRTMNTFQIDLKSVEVRKVGKLELNFARLRVEMFHFLCFPQKIG